MGEWEWGIGLAINRIDHCNTFTRSSGSFHRMDEIFANGIIYHHTHRSPLAIGRLMTVDAVANAVMLAIVLIPFPSTAFHYGWLTQFQTLTGARLKCVCVSKISH